ncbi:MAG: sulfatase-like hydrolase/transferase [Myxococcota bacterium]
MAPTGLGLVLLWCGSAQAFETRNVLVIVADDLGVDKVEAYCDDRTTDGACDHAADPTRYAMVPPTPRLNALAAQGIRFDNAYAEPLCTPSRASLLTGLTVPEHGLGAVVDPDDMEEPDLGLDPSIPTLPEVLPAGMVKGLVGKWHLSAYHDFGLPGAADLVDGDRDGVTDLCANEGYAAADCEAFDARPAAYGFDFYDGRLRGDFTYDVWARSVMDGAARSVVWMDTARGNEDYVDTVAAQSALDFVQRTTEPWLLVVAFQSPHWPWHHPPAPDALPGVFADPTTTAYSSTPGRYATTCGGNRVQRAAGEMVQSLDHHVGVLLDAIDLSTTTVVFVSDNGSPAAVLDPAYSGSGPLNSKGHVYEGGVRVPLIVAGPDVDPARAGSADASLVHIRDLFATVLDLTDTATTPPASSVSFAGRLAATPTGGRDHVYSSRHTSAGHANNSGAPYDRCAFQVRNDHAKLLADDLGLQLFRTSGDFELYDSAVSNTNPMGDICWATTHAPPYLPGQGSSLAPQAQSQYRALRDLVLTEYPDTCWLEEHEMNCCDGDDNDNDGLLDGDDPDCACDPDNVTSAACTTPPQ